MPVLLYRRTMVPKADDLADSEKARRLDVLGHLKSEFLGDTALGFRLKTSCYIKLSPA